jgi:hypothetical protein
LRKAIVPVTAHTEKVRTIAVSSADHLLISGSQDGTPCVGRITDDGLVCFTRCEAMQGLSSVLRSQEVEIRKL